MEGNYLKNVTAVLLLIIISMLPLSAMAEDLPVTSPFGWREDPYTGEWRFHTGVDLGYEYGAGIPALFDGVVADAGDNGDGYGNQVLLYHPYYDVYTRYAHMAAVYVRADQYVVQGDIIGLVGATGYVTGAHLHLEYIVRDADGNYIYADPLVLWQ